MNTDRKPGKTSYRRGRREMQRSAEVCKKIDGINHRGTETQRRNLNAKSAKRQKALTTNSEPEWPTRMNTNGKLGKTSYRRERREMQRSAEVCKKMEAKDKTD
jgi:hypothetical protein